MRTRRWICLMVLVLVAGTPLLHIHAQNREAYEHAGADSYWVSNDMVADRQTILSWQSYPYSGANNPQFHIFISEVVNGEVLAPFYDRDLLNAADGVYPWNYEMDCRIRVETQDINMWEITLQLLIKAPSPTHPTTTTTTTSPVTETTTPTTSPIIPTATVTVVVGEVTTTQQITVVQKLVETTTVAVRTETITHAVWTELPPNSKMVSIGFMFYGGMLVLLAIGGIAFYYVRTRGDILILDKSREEESAEDETIHRSKGGGDSDGIKIVK